MSFQSITRGFPDLISVVQEVNLNGFNLLLYCFLPLRDLRTDSSEAFETKGAKGYRKTNTALGILMQEIRFGFHLLGCL
mgnify:CR=1 FL=1